MKLTNKQRNAVASFRRELKRTGDGDTFTYNRKRRVYEHKIFGEVSLPSTRLLLRFPAHFLADTIFSLTLTTEQKNRLKVRVYSNKLKKAA